VELVHYLLDPSLKLTTSNRKSKKIILFCHNKPLIQNLTMSTPVRELSRHRTQDGRNSLKSHLFAPRKNGGIMSMWTSRIAKKETIPLMICVGAGVGLAAWFGTRHLATSSDVRIDKTKRKSTIRPLERGDNQLQHRESMRNLAPSYAVGSTEGVAK